MKKPLKNKPRFLLILTFLVLTFSVLTIHPKTSKLFYTKQSTKILADSTSSEDKYIIKLKKNSDPNNFVVSKILNKKKSKKSKLLNTISVSLTKEELLQIKNDNEIEYIEEDSKLTTFEDNEHSQVTPWGISDVGALQAIDKGYKGQGINIAILDTGIGSHEDLTIKGGISFVDGNNSFADDQGHGTHVAGIIGAFNNDLGTLGVAPEANLYSVKVLDENGIGSYSQLIQGIEWAIENKMNIISMSLGGKNDSIALHDIIKKAKEQGILLVASAGNDGIGEETEAFPARFPEVLSVGAVDSSHLRANFSSTGSELDLMAPGQSILSTTLDGKYDYMSGTSMAASHVAGIAATLWSSNSQYNSNDVREKLLSTAIRTGNPNEYGKGIVSLSNALGINQNINQIPINSTKLTIEQYENDFNMKLNSLKELKSIAIQKKHNDFAKEIENIYHQVLIQKNSIYKTYYENIKQVSSLKKKNISIYNQEYFETHLDEFLKLQKFLYEKVLYYTNLLNVHQLNKLLNDYEEEEEDYILVPNQPKNLELTEDNTIFTFTPTKSEDYRIFTGFYNGSGPMYDTYLEIYSDADLTNLIGSNDDDGFTWFSEVNINLTENTTYYVKVINFGGNNYMKMSLCVQEHELVQNILLDTPVNITDHSKTKYRFEFTAPKNSVYRFTSDHYDGDPNSIEMDTEIVIYSDSQFTRIIAYGSYGYDVFSETSLALNEGSKVYIELRGDAVQSVIGLHTRFNISTSPSSGEEIKESSQKNVYISENQYALYKFQPPATKYYQITTKPYDTSYSSDTVLAIYDKTELTTVLTENNDISPTNTSSAINKYLEQGKTYYLLVKGYANSSVATSIYIAGVNSYFYDDEGKLDYIILLDGRKLDYIYDGNGNLIRKRIV